MQSSAVDKRELYFNAMAGLIGGAIGWVPVEITSHGHSLIEVQSDWSLLAGLVSMALAAGMIGGMIVAAEAQQFEWSSSVGMRFLRGFIICFLIALPGTHYSNVLFNAILTSGGWSMAHTGSWFSLHLARIIGWALMGLSVGLGVGIATFSARNIVKGAIGGLIGGFVGGLFFDPIGALSQSGLLSRLIGFAVIGLAIGFFIGLVQQLTKTAWLLVEAGRLKGRQFRLEGTTIGIGRAEENPVGLFGDAAVQPRHALIEHRNDNYSIRNMAVQAGTFVNGNRIETAILHEGDKIQIGGYQLSFHVRTEARDGRSAPPVENTQRAMAPVSVVAGGAPYLARLNGERLKLEKPVIRIGRALDNDIVLQDASVSRHHAEIERRDGVFLMRDLGSQNGTWVADNRITEVRLTPGDHLRIGDAAFTFHG
jgi:pSer/pThr/pTyr-binding forkhead associated (FHA) protein